VEHEGSREMKVLGVSCCGEGLARGVRQPRFLKQACSFASSGRTHCARKVKKTLGVPGAAANSGSHFPALSAGATYPLGVASTRFPRGARED
jgi:hypothetical protein